VIDLGALTWSIGLLVVVFVVLALSGARRWRPRC
jgi:hypothetical protein